MAALTKKSTRGSRRLCIADKTALRKYARPWRMRPAVRAHAIAPGLRVRAIALGSRVLRRHMSRCVMIILLRLGNSSRFFIFLRWFYRLGVENL